MSLNFLSVTFDETDGWVTPMDSAESLSVTCLHQAVPESILDSK
jgi:hypothetical protein